MRVIVADQDAENRKKLVDAIQGWGHTVLEALSDREIVALCRKKCPDLVFLDSMLSGQPGIEVVSQIRQTGGHALWVPIVLLGEKFTTEDLLKAVDAGVDDVLVKPTIEIKLKLKVHSAKRLLELKEEVFGIAHQLVLENQNMQSVMSNQDVLTGLNNSNSFEQKVDKEFDAYKKSKEPLSLLFLNIDYFRKYNEEHGAEEGDAAMKNIATAMKNTAPSENCFLARTVGDTFAALLPKTPSEQAFKLGQAFQQAVNDLNIANPSSGCGDRLTLSFGLATVTEGNGMEKSFDLKDAADFGLYKAKHSGRNQGFVVTEAEAVKQ